MRNRTHILLPVHNRIDVTHRFIEFLKAQNYTNYHLVLIDDGSSDGTAEMVRHEISDTTVITGRGNWWWGGSLQQGYLWLKGQSLSPDDYILIMNDDTEFSSDFIQNGLDVISKKKRSMLIAHSYSKTSGKLLNSGIYFFDFKNFIFNKTEDLSSVNCTNTRGLLLKVKDFLNVGGFRPKLLPHYLSDIEFTYRAIKKGITPLSDKNFKFLFVIYIF